MTEEKMCPTFLIEDIPADEDAFGPHQRVADAIADLIESSEKGGKVIGLEGGWGAGKSTVVGFLAKRLSKNSNYTVISFDAWAHEGDPLRRTYLETLIQELRSTEWVDNIAWEKCREEIANRRKETTTRITPKPTKLGIALAISLLLVPLGSVFLSAGLRTGVTIELGSPPNVLFILGLLLALSPFWVLLANFVRVQWSQNVKQNSTVKNEGDEIKAGSDEMPSEWAFLFSRAINETRTETIESPNPTSIEFEAYFTNLMREALGASEERRCLLVLDNLDRVEPESALAIWSTLQTFLQDRTHRSEGWFRRLWVVVPFDPTGLRKLWDKRSSGDERTVSAGVNDGAASDSFLDKSFQVRFHVPPPVLSDWKAYVYRLVEEALPNHGQPDRHWVYRVFDLCRTRTGEPPTPRELKLYVNQIGATHRMWQHEFPIQHVAYYVLQRRARQSIIERLRGESAFPSDQDVAVLGEGLRRSLAGLAFNVEPEKGIELLLAEPIYQALVDGDHLKLRQLEEDNPDGFWAVLEVVATSKLSDTDAQSIAKAASCLKDSGIIDDNRHEVANVINGLKDAGKDITTWTPFDGITASGVSALCALVNTKEMTEGVLKSVCSTLADSGENTESSVAPQSIIEPLLLILQQVTSLGHSESIPNSITVPISADQWPAATVLIAQADPEGIYWRYLSPNADFADVSAVLEPRVGAGQFNEQEITTIRVTSSSPINSTWNALINQIRDRLDAGANVAPPEALQLFQALNMLRKLGSAEATNALMQLADAGHTLHHFHRANAKNRHDCKAICLLSFLRERPGAEKPTAAGNSDEGHNNLMSTLAAEDADTSNQLLTLLREYDDVSLLLKVAESRSQFDPLICTALRDVAESKEAEELFTPQIIRESWKELRSALNGSSDEDRFSILVGRLARTTTLCRSIQEAEGGFSTDELDLYLSIIEGVKEEVASFADWCRVGLEQLSTNEWVSLLSGEFTCCRLVLELADQGRRPDMRTGFADALVIHAKSVMSGLNPPPLPLQEKWCTLLDCLSEGATRKELQIRLIDAAALQDGTINAHFFEMYGKELNDADILAAHSQIVSHLFSPMLRERNVAGLRWLDTILDDHMELFDKISDETTVEALASRVRDCLTTPLDDDAQSVIEEIAKKVGVEAQDAKTETTTDEHEEPKE